jgi:hypothetical protein
MNRLWDLHGKVQPHLFNCSSQEAVTALLGQGPAYDTGVPEHLGVYDPNRISLPAAGLPTPLVDLLEAESVPWLNIVDEHRLLLSQSEFGALLEGEGRIVPYMDPVLARSPKQYRGFLSLMSASGVLTWTCCPRDRVGVFFVRKKNDSLRVILDARSPNRRFKRPPSMAIANGSDFSRIDVSGVEQLYVAMGDIDNAFYRMKMPHDLSRFFCMPDVEGSFLLNLGVYSVEGQQVRAEGSYSPCMAAMPMGWSWAFYFCHQVFGAVGLRYKVFEFG